MSKNILYIGPYRDFSGAGNSCRNYIHALHKAGHDLCIAPIFYTGDIYPENQISSEILPLETNHLSNYDIIIQQCSPFDYCRDYSFEKNIGIFQFSSGSISPSIISRLNIMDKIIVNSPFNYNAVKSHCDTHQLSNKIKVFPELIPEINLNYEEYNWIKKDSCVFYTIGDMIDRKNIEKIVLAYLQTFNAEDNVELVIKTKNHYSDKETGLIQKTVNYMLERSYRIIKKNQKDTLKPKIMIGQFSQEGILSLHKNCSCYIDAARAENFGMSVLEACAFNNHIIVNANSSTKDISDNAWLTQSYKAHTIDSHSSNFIKNRISDFWYDVDVMDLAANMRSVYMQHQTQQESSHNLDKYQFSTVNELIA